MIEAGKLRRQPFRERGRLLLVFTDPGKTGPIDLIDHIGERDTADWPKPAHGVADRQQGIGVHAAAPPSIALACSTRGTCHTRTLLSWTPQKKNIVSSTPLERLRATDRAVRGSPKGGYAMGRKTVA
jgi:hypothetical protein